MRYVLLPKNVSGFEHQEIEALRQKISVWFGDETAFGLATAPELRARLKRIAPDEVPFLQVPAGKIALVYYAIFPCVPPPRARLVAVQLCSLETFTNFF